VRESVAAVSRVFSAYLLVSALLVVPAFARADANDDGLYGRFDGDLWLGAALGGGAAFVVSEGSRDAGVLELRARYLDSVGPVLYAQGSGLLGGAGAW